MNFLSILGLILNIFGSILLAYSLQRTSKMLNISITALENFKDTFLANENVISITGMEIHRKKALKNAGLLTSLGLIFLIIGFALQLLLLIMTGK